jgi:hypothetical protein
MKSNKIGWALGATVACLIFALGCSRVTPPISEKRSIRPPIPELDLPFMVFRVECDRENLIELPKGGRLKVPANAFVDADGQAVTGTVELRYREMQDALDIFLTGIPMDYDSAGSRQLETAGMFELRGSQNGREVQVKPGAELELRLASMTPGNDYNAYFFDEKVGNWQFLSYSSGEPNPQKAKINEKLQQLDAQLSEPQMGDNFVLDYSSALDVEYNHALCMHNIMEINGKRTVLDTIVKVLDHDQVMSKIQRYGLVWYNALGHGIVEFADRSRYPAAFVVWHRLDNDPLPAWLYPRKAPKGKTNYAGDPHPFEILENGLSTAQTLRVKKNEYVITFYAPQKMDSFSMRVQALMPLEELFQRNAKSWRKDHVGVKQALEKERAMWAQRAMQDTVAEAFRTISMSGMGIYNFDKLLEAQKILVRAEFRFKGVSGSQQLQNAWVVTEGNRSVFNLKYASSKLPIEMVTGQKAKIVAITADNRLAVLPTKRYQQIDFSSVKKSPNQPIVLELEVGPNPVASKDEVVRVFQEGN